jgi:hypothetical protein
MKSLLLATVVGAFLATSACGGSAKGVQSGSGGVSANAMGGATGNGGAAGSSGDDASVGAGTDASAVSGKCPQVAPAPCGGNVVGTWTLKFDECAFPAASSAYCPGLTFSIDPSSNYAAIYTFNADNTLSATTAGSVVSTTNYPPSCLSGDAGAAESCAQLSKFLQDTAPQVGDAGTNNISSSTFSCSSDPTGTCVCDSKVTYTSRAVSGHYTTSGTKIVITAPRMSDAGVIEQSTDSPTDYCVSGNTLTIWPTTPSSNSKPAVLTR